MDNYLLNRLAEFLYPSARFAYGLEGFFRPYAGFIVGVVLLLWVYSLRSGGNVYIGRLWAGLLVIFLLIGPGLYYVLIYYAGFIQNKVISAPNVYLQVLIWGVPAGMLCVLLWWRFITPVLSQMYKHYTRRTQFQRTGRTDARNIDEVLPKQGEGFNPEDYFCHTSECFYEKGFFVGLDEDNQPVRIPFQELLSSHVAVSGITGIGKGVTVLVLLFQHVLNGEFVVTIDPKGDHFAMAIMKRAAEWVGKKLVLLNLNYDFHPQINPLVGASMEDLISLFLAIFNLGEKGDIADFHRSFNRDVATTAARIVSESDTPMTFADLYKYMEKEKLLKDVPGFAIQLKELASLKSINARNGVDLQSLLDDGGVVYVVGDTVNETVLRAQRMLALRIMQMAKRRDHTVEQRPVTMFLDETRYHISKQLLALLGVSRSYGIHCYLAYQSYDDLLDTPADLEAVSVKGGVVGNSGIKFCYRSADPDSAEWHARLGGTILVDDEVREIKRNPGLSETVSSERTLRSGEAFRIDTNILLNLPNRCAVMFSNGNAQYVFINPIQIEKVNIPVFRPLDETEENYCRPNDTRDLIDVD